MARSWLLLRHGGCLWGIAGEQVQSIDHSHGQYRLQVGTHQLEVDEVVSFAALHQIRPLGSVLSAVAPAGCDGLAICDQGPVVVIDAESPPAVLLVHEEQSAAQGEA